MTRDEVIRAVATIAVKNRVSVFVGNGYNSRALCALEDQAEFFYVIGSMGLCPTLAAGFSHCRQLPVIAVEGDGNALMGLSGFPVVSRAARGTFIHIVLDNGLYESTGGQQTLSLHMDFAQIALGAGYDGVHHPNDTSSLEAVLEVALQESYRTFIWVSTESSAEAVHPRVPYHPLRITQRFREATLSRFTL